MAEFGRVLVTRHPETVSNVEHFFSGRMDVALTERGRAQAREAAEAIAAWGPERIFTSPLSRCRAIADDAAARLGLEPVVDERLVEIEFGAIEGIRLDQLAARGYRFPWPIEDGRTVPAPGAESFEDLIARARSFVDYVATLPGKTSCITHGGLSRALFAAVYDEPVDTFWNHMIVNVASAVFVSNGSRLMLQTAGLMPSELKARAERGFVPGGDVGSTSLSMGPATQGQEPRIAAPSGPSAGLAGSSEIPAEPSADPEGPLTGPEGFSASPVHHSTEDQGA